MKRTFATTFAIALLGVGACKGGSSGDAVKLVPDTASFIGGIDLAAVQKSDLWNDNKKYLEEGEGKEAIEAAKACNLGPETWKSVTFGVHHSTFMGSGDDAPAAVVILSVDGIGKKENLECVQGKIKEKSGEESWTMEEKDGRLVLDLDKGKDVGYVVNDNTLVIAGKGWSDAVKELIDGKGKPAVDNGLKDAVATADMGKAIWFAGNLPGELLAGSPAEGAKTASGSIDLKSGLGLAASVTFGSADDAKAKADELQQQFDGVKGMAGAVGVPQGVTDSVKIEAKGAAVNVSANMSTDDIKKLQETISQAGGL